MTQVFLISSSVSPWSKPGDWQDAGHTVDLVGAGGIGGPCVTGTSYRGGSGGGGGGHVLLTYSSGTLASTTAFYVGASSTIALNHATKWQSNSSAAVTNSYYVQAGVTGISAGAGGLGGDATTVLNGTAPGPVYTASQQFNGGTGGATAAVGGSGAGGGGSGGPSGVGGTGGPCITAARGGGGGGAGNGGGSAASTSGTSSGTQGANSGGAGGTSSTAAGNGGANTGSGGGGGFFSAIGAATTTGGTGGTGVTTWMQTSDIATAGAGGGGGAGGGNSSTTSGPTTSGGSAGNYGAGGGGVGGTRSATSTRVQGAGASGLIVIFYIGPPTALTPTLYDDTDAALIPDVALVTSLPVNTLAPAVTGTAQVGQTLSCTTGTWDGIPTPTLAYEWYRVGPTFLIHCNGTNGSTTFTDVAGAKTVTAVAGAAVSTSQSKFGGASLYVSGGSFLQVASHADFGFGTGDFTVDFWFRRDGAQGQNNLFVMQGNVWIVYVEPSLFRLRFYWNGVVIAGTTVVTDNVWHHAALTRSSGSTRLFLDGVQEGSTYSDTSNLGPSLFSIGANSDGASYMTGWIDEVRVIKGAAAWTANFTPPTSEY